MRFEPAADDPLSYEGPEIVRCKGCTINWKKDKNVTVKTVRRTKKGKGGNKSITKVVQSDSFFNFFNAEENGENEKCFICLTSNGKNVPEWI